VSYTLRGRLETRLAAALLPALVASVLAVALTRWWPVEVLALMVAVGLALDVVAWHRLLPYQPGWVAVPVGLVELWLTTQAARLLDLGAPLAGAAALFAFAWLVQQVTAHAVLPSLRLTYAEDGGELGAVGPGLATAVPVAVAAALGVAWATQPPIVRLSSGVHQGPLVLDRSQRLVGEPGAVVRGGIRVRADDVTVRDVTVVGGEIGIEVRDSERVTLDGVHVRGATLDGINARQSSVTIRDCQVVARPGGQGIDISFGMHEEGSTVRDCTIRGGTEGIVTNMANVEVEGNHVAGTSLRGISLTEMSMGGVVANDVTGALGIGIFCGDMSHCEIERNRISGTRVDPSGGRSRAGWDVVAHYYAHATLADNAVGRGAASFVGGSIVEH
jgi:nitrous oxidase accessory protein NosD